MSEVGKISERITPVVKPGKTQGWGLPNQPDQQSNKEQKNKPGESTQTDEHLIDIKI